MGEMITVTLTPVFGLWSTGVAREHLIVSTEPAAPWKAHAWSPVLCGF